METSYYGSSKLHPTASYLSISIREKSSMLILKLLDWLKHTKEEVIGNVEHRSLERRGSGPAVLKESQTSDTVHYDAVELRSKTGGCSYASIVGAA